MIMEPISENELRQIANTDMPRFIRLWLHVIYDDLIEDFDRHIRNGVPDPRGHDAWLADRFEVLTGVKGIGALWLQHLQATCPLCEQPAPSRSCDICRLVMCDTCRLTHEAARTLHGDRSLCLQTSGYAEVHATMRQHFLNGSDEPCLPEAEDFFTPSA